MPSRQTATENTTARAANIRNQLRKVTPGIRDGPTATIMAPSPYIRLSRIEPDLYVCEIGFVFSIATTDLVLVLISHPFSIFAGDLFVRLCASFTI
jgi:hypothetical protein